MLAMKSELEQIVSSEDLVSHTIKKRGCQFNFEGSLDLFQNYHQAGCMFECLLKQSYLKANCTPVYYPRFKEEQQTCHFINVIAFEKEMKSTTAIRTCQEKCPQECTKNTILLIRGHLQVLPTMPSGKVWIRSRVGFVFHYWTCYFWNNCLNGMLFECERNT